MASSSSKITLHHLQHSQSERIIWLLEELSLPYELKLYKRAPLLAPPELKAVSEAGTAPVIEDGDLKLGESGAIAQYLIHKAGNDKLTPGPGHPDYTTYLYWYYWVLCSLQPKGSAAMAVFFDSAIPEDARSRQFTRSRFQSCLQIVDRRLGSVPYLAGSSFTLADIMIVFVFGTFRDFLPYSLKDYPNIVDYVKRMMDRPAYKKAWRNGEGDWKGITGIEPEKPPFF